MDPGETETAISGAATASYINGSNRVVTDVTSNIIDDNYSRLISRLPHGRAVL